MRLSVGRRCSEVTTPSLAARRLLVSSIRRRETEVEPDLRARRRYTTAGGALRASGNRVMLMA